MVLASNRPLDFLFAAEWTTVDMREARESTAHSPLINAGLYPTKLTSSQTDIKVAYWETQSLGAKPHCHNTCYGNIYISWRVPKASIKDFFTGLRQLMQPTSTELRYSVEECPEEEKKMKLVEYKNFAITSLWLSREMRRSKLIKDHFLKFRWHRSPIELIFKQCNAYRWDHKSKKSRFLKSLFFLYIFNFLYSYELHASHGEWVRRRVWLLWEIKLTVVPNSCTVTLHNVQVKGVGTTDDTPRDSSALAPAQLDS